MIIPKLNDKLLPNYSQLCTEYYELDKPHAPEDALAYYSNHASQSEGIILEPMCGSGRFQIPLLLKGYDIVGFDSSPSIIKACLERCTRLGITTKNRVFLASFDNFVPDDIYKLIFIPSGSFSLLIKNKEVDQALKFIKKYLAKDGKFIFEVDMLAAKNKNPNIWQQSFAMKPDGNKIILNSFSQFNENTKIETTICCYQLWQDDQLIKQETEHFKVRLYEDAEILNLLKKYNFKIIAKHQPYTKDIASN